MKRQQQRGVAIITALVVVAAATIVVAGMLWRQSVAVRKLENQNALAQARWLGRSAIEWSRLILQQDARLSAVDHLGEIWAVPLAETRLADAFKPVDSGDPATAAVADARVSGQIFDAQARFNLANLMLIQVPVTNDKAAPFMPGVSDVPKAVEDGKAERYNKTALAQLQRLLEVLSQPEDAALVIALRMNALPLPLDWNALAAELVQSGQIEPAIAAALQPYVVLLPRATPVNFNTAPAEVMAALLPSLSLTQARLLVQSRDRIYFNQVSDVIARLSTVNAAVNTAVNASVSNSSNASPSSSTADVAVASHFFEVQGQVRTGRAEYALTALIERDNGGLTHVLRLQE